MFELFIPFVIIGIVFLVLRSQYKRQMTFFLRQTRKRNARVKSSFSVFAKLIVRDRGREIVIHETPGKRNAPPTTHLRCRLDSAKNYKIRIGPENALIRIGKSIGIHDFQTGNHAFDESFLIRGSDEMTIRSFLTPEIQASLLGLNGLLPTIRIENRGFRFSITGNLTKEEQYDQFIDAGMKMIQRANEIG